MGVRNRLPGAAGWLVVWPGVASAAGPLQGGADSVSGADPGSLAVALFLGLCVVMAVVLCVLLCQLLDRQEERGLFTGIDAAPWPTLTVFVVARAQDTVISTCLQRLLASDYPAQALRIVPVCDPGDTQSRAIINAYALLFPERILPCHRSAAAADGGGALSEALALAQGDLAVLLDIGHIPSPDCLRQLAKPFFDPEVGLVVGHVRPAGESDLKRRLSGPWRQRMAALGMGPAVWAVRLSALQAMGDAVGRSLGDLDHARQHLRAQGWATVSQPRAVCERAASPQAAAQSRPVVPASPAATVQSPNNLQRAPSAPVPTQPLSESRTANTWMEHA